MLADESLAETSLSGKSTTSASGPPSAPPHETPQFSHPRARMLLNGRIQHGSQFLGEQRKIPTSYYVLTSGIGRTLLSLPQDRARRVGVVGLGTGTLAAYGRGGDFYCFYEINPAVVDLAKQYFTYLSDCPAEQEIVLGDARLSLEREAPRQYDVLALDAFSGDAIPAHLLTDEAFAAYRRHLAPRGVLAVHISNRYLDLEPVVARAALRHRLAIRSVETQESTWLLLAVDAAVFEHEALAGAVTTVPPHDGFPLWTDAYYNTLGILR
jgi:SAM-dependent methyltransferase